MDVVEADRATYDITFSLPQDSFCKFTVSGDKVAKINIPEPTGSTAYVYAKVGEVAEPVDANKKTFSQDISITAGTTLHVTLINYDTTNSLNFAPVATTTWVPPPEECFSCLTAGKQYCTDKATYNICDVASN